MRLPVVLVAIAAACGGSPRDSATVAVATRTISLSVSTYGFVVLPDGKHCAGGEQCTVSVPEGKLVRFSAEQAEALRFDSWTAGPCQGSSAIDCTFTVRSDVALAARFSRLFAMTIRIVGFGHGSIVQGRNVFRDNGFSMLAADDGCLHAVPDADSTFNAWGPSPLRGDVTVDGDGDLCLGGNSGAEVDASFSLIPRPGQFLVEAAMQGAGHGRVVSSPEGIDVATTAEGAIVDAKSGQAMFQPGTTVTLKAIPAEGSRFGGWTGACSGTGDCVLTEAASVRALFAVNLVAVRYDVQDLGAIGFTGAVNGIAPDGTVFGAMDAPLEHSVAFVAKDGVQSLPLDDPHDSAATGMNAAGTVVGWLGMEPQSRGDPGRRPQAFRFSAGAVELLGDFGGGSSQAYAIDAAGTIVGIASGVQGSGGAFRWDGSLAHLPGLPNGCFASSAAAMSANGIVAGSLQCPAPPGQFELRAALFLPDGAHDLSLDIGANVAIAVNSSGQALLVTSRHTYLWDGASAHLLPDGYRFSALDDAGHLVATHSADPVFDGAYGVLFTDGQPANLNALVDEPRWTIRSAAGVDPAGRIAALGELSLFERHALRLVPRR